MEKKKNGGKRSQMVEVVEENMVDTVATMVKTMMVAKNKTIYNSVVEKKTVKTMATMAETAMVAKNETIQNGDDDVINISD